MEALRDAARAHGLWIVSDEVYAHFTYGPAFRNDAIAPSFLQVCGPGDRLIVTTHFSKNWAMTGWRAGWMVFPEGLAEVFGKLGQYNTTSIPTFVAARGRGGAGGRGRVHPHDGGAVRGKPADHGRWAAAAARGDGGAPRTGRST